MDRKTWIVNEAKKIDEKIREIPRAYREVPLVQGSRSIEELQDHLINDPYPEETRDLHRAFHMGEMNVLAKLAGGLGVPDRGPFPGGGRAC